MTKTPNGEHGVRALQGSDPIQRKPLVEALFRRPTPKRPVWIMRQAGRYLPEYREFRKDHSFKDLAGNPDLATEVTLMPLKRFALDAAIVFADIMSPLPAIGVEFDFDPGPVVAHPIRNAKDLERLHAPDDTVACEVIRTLELVRKELSPSTALLGFAGAPWTLAAYLVEGKGAKEFPTLRAFAAAEPELLGALLGKLTNLMADYLIAQHEAGADAVQIFDSWAGLLSLADWRRLIEPHLKQLLERLGAAGVPRILFLQNAPHLVDAYAGLPAEALATDWRLDLGELQRRYPDRAVQGNIDPAILLAGPEPTRAATSALLGSVEAAGHIVNLGHGILPTTPIASVEALIGTVEEESS
jgi:uroporphyrinogen decarboxylase